MHAVLFFHFLSVACASAVASDGIPPAFDPLLDSLAVTHHQSDATAKVNTSPNLLFQIGTDFRNVFTSKENLVIVTGGLGAAYGASLLDERIVDSRFNSKRNDGTVVDGFFEGGSILGGPLVQVGSSVGLYGIGKLISKPGVEQLGRDFVRALVVTQSFTFLLKYAVGRQRPDGSDNSSFPSGHASGTFAMATVLQRHYGWKAGALAYAIASYVAASRLSESKHYLSDVVFGAALGIMAGRTVTVEIARSRFAVSPSLRAGEFGVRLAWLGANRNPK